MAWRFAIRGNLRAYTELVEHEAAGAVATVIRSLTTALKNAIRREIIAAGLGERLANAVRSQVWPERGGSLGAHGRVWSKAIYKRPGGLVDLFTVFEEGARIRGGYLALPLTALKSPQDTRRRASPGDYPEGTFDVIPTRRAGVFVVTVKDDPDEALWILVRGAHIRRRLNLTAIHARIEGGADARLEREFNQRLTKAAQRRAA